MIVKPTRLCRICNIEKPFKKFPSVDGRYVGRQCTHCLYLRNSTNRIEARARNWRHSLFAFARGRARRDEREFSITPQTIDRLWDEQQGRCYWFGIPLITTGQSYHPEKPSLDRLILEEGYTETNVVLSTLVANLGQSGCPAIVFREFCNKLLPEFTPPGEEKDVMATMKQRTKLLSRDS